MRVITRGGGRAYNKNKKSVTHTNTESSPPQKSVSQSAQDRKSILRSPLRGRSQKEGNADSSTQGNCRWKKAARPKSAWTLTKQTSKTDGEEKVRGSYGFLPDELQ